MNTHRLFLTAFVAFAFIFISAASVSAQETTAKVVPAKMPTAGERTAFAGYKGVMIGLTADEARRKLGDPRDKSDTQDFYVYGERESAQVYYDKNGKVSLVSVSFVGEVEGIPTPQQVFGEPIDAKPDGSIYKMVRYPKLGYWISYNRTAGEDPIVTITVQKLPGT
jgi:hypothetical protein